MQDKEFDAQLLKQRTANEYDHYEYPKALYRDKPKGFERREIPGWVPPAPFETMIANSAEEEAAAIEDGYRLTPTAKGG